MAGKKRKDRRHKRPRDDSEKNPISSTCTSSEANVKGGDVDDKVTSQVPVEESKPTHQEASTFAVTQTQERKRKKKRKRKNGSLNDSSPSKKQKLKDGKDNKEDSKAASMKKAPSFPYPTETDDHCETPLQAYRDILPLLQKIAGTKNEDICIYDPYYCNAAVAKNLNELGFANVYNREEDCYQTWNSPDRYPVYDILITNPPYSDNHMERLMQHITSPAIKDRPWFLLMPNWVHKKDFYTAATSNIRPFYVVPHKRYVYVPPADYREAKKSDVHKKSSPWHSMWYIWGGSSAKNEQLIRAFYISNSADHCDLARSKSALRDLRRKKRD